jgi:pilus assembly protein CpaE
MRVGIRDVVDMSIGPNELSDALRRALGWSESLRSVAGEEAEVDKNGMLISIFSSKGGTGKTFLACNLAAALADLSGSDVAVCDLDFDLGDVFSYFGQDASRSIGDLTSLVETSDQASVMGAGVRLADHLWGFGAPHDPTAPVVSGSTSLGILKALRRIFGFVVVDASADYSEQALAAFDLSDTICLVAGLDVVGVKHLANAMETLMSIDIPRERLRIVLNRADSKVGLEVSDVQRVLDLEIEARIPSSRLVPASLNRGRPVYIQDPKADVSKSLAALARTFIARRQPPPPPKAVSSRRRLFARGG